jgi:hypothetical protein
MRPIQPLVGLASFLVFLLLGARLWRRSDGAPRRRAIRDLAIYVVAAHLIAGLTQVDNWPFTSHSIGVGRPRTERELCVTEFLGVDAAGREWRLDPFSFAPVFDSILQHWCMKHLDGLGHDGRSRVLGFLLEKAEAARDRMARGLPIGSQTVLGSLGASYWWLLPRTTDVSRTPYVGLRLYRACWSPEQRLRDPGRVSRRLAAERRR